MAQREPSLNELESISKQHSRKRRFDAADMNDLYTESYQVTADVSKPVERPTKVRQSSKLMDGSLSNNSSRQATPIDDVRVSSEMQQDIKPLFYIEERINSSEKANNAEKADNTESPNPEPEKIPAKPVPRDPKKNIAQQSQNFKGLNRAQKRAAAREASQAQASANKSPPTEKAEGDTVSSIAPLTKKQRKLLNKAISQANQTSAAKTEPAKGQKRKQSASSQTETKPPQPKKKLKGAAKKRAEAALTQIEVPTEAAEREYDQVKPEVSSPQSTSTSVNTPEPRVSEPAILTTKATILSMDVLFRKTKTMPAIYYLPAN